MKTQLIIAVLIVLSGFFSCQNNSKQATNETTMESKEAFSAVADKNVKAYYFHNTRRCNTCQTVESVTKLALKEIYGDKVMLESVNIEEAESKLLTNKFEITSQTLLLIVNGVKIDLTNDAFMYAVTKPEKLKESIKMAVSKTI